MDNEDKIKVEISKWVREDGSILCMMPYAAWDPPGRTISRREFFAG